MTHTIYRIASNVFAFKCLIQRTSIGGISWEKIPVQFANNWMELLPNLNKLNEFRVRRCVVPIQIHTQSLHVFCYASEKTYAALVYLRTEDADQSIRASVLTSKTRVDFVKHVYMQHLELRTAQLGATILNTMGQSFNIPGVSAWSGSTIVLHWLVKLPCTWITFVANRLASIQEILPRNFGIMLRPRITLEILLREMQQLPNYM